MVNDANSIIGKTGYPPTFFVTAMEKLVYIGNQFPSKPISRLKEAVTL